MSRKITHKQKIFATEYMQHGNGTRAALVAFDVDRNKPKEKYENAAAIVASQTLKKPHVAQFILDHAKEAANTIFDLSQNSANDTVRLNASKDILDRAGFKAVDTPPTPEDNQLTTTQLLQAVETLKHAYSSGYNAATGISGDGIGPESMVKKTSAEN